MANRGSKEFRGSKVSEGFREFRAFKVRLVTKVTKAIPETEDTYTPIRTTMEI